MVIQTCDRWYSNGLTVEVAESLEKKYAKIQNPTFGLAHFDHLALRVDLHYEDGSGTREWIIQEPEDMKQLFLRTKTTTMKQLGGKVVEVYINIRDMEKVKGLSVNENLV